METAIEYIDDLAAVLIKIGIAPDLVKEVPGVWNGAVDLSRIWAHDETPQFINYNASGQSKKHVYAGIGHDCNKVTKENHECVTVQPFSNFAGEMAMCQVILSESGLNSQMCPLIAAGRIDNLIVSVNESGCSTGETLLAAYKELTKIIERKKGARSVLEMDVVVADGHKSHFNVNLMSHCDENSLDQFKLPPDTSGVTQMHAQINQYLHSCYENKKSEMYSEYADLNKECFMNILAEIWDQWARPERICKAGKHVGVSKDGLSANWMDKNKFEQAAAILSPSTPTKTKGAIAIIKTPEGV